MSEQAPPAAGIPSLSERFDGVYVALDGSAWSDRAARIAVEIAHRAGTTVTGAHAYAVRLHDERFRQMEGGLPPRYHREEELERQRTIHDSLIDRGLGLISDAYLDPVAALAEARDVPFVRRNVEGRNWRVLLDDVTAARSSLLVLGRFGMGRTRGIDVGSVCERVVRRLPTNALVVGSHDDPPFARVGVAVDGSAASLDALHAAIAVAKAFGGTLAVMSSFDPHFHYRVFRRLGGVLSADAGKVFKIADQEKIHEEIIDDGLARIYQEHLDVAVQIAAEAGIEAPQRHLLTGKAPTSVRQFARDAELTALFLGRTGIHSEGGLDLGAVTDLLLRTPDTPHLYLAAGAVDPAQYVRFETPLPWTEEASTRMERVPPHVRSMAAGAVERRARDMGHSVVTSDLIDAVLASMRGGPPSTAPAKPTLHWDAAALARLVRLPEPARAPVSAAVEEQAVNRGYDRVTSVLVEEVLARRPATKESPDE